MNRRDFLGSCTAALTVAALGGLGRCPAFGAEPPAMPRDLPDQSDKAPALPVALLRCESYEPKVFRAALAQSFDLIGGIQSLVRDKTVTVKLNLSGMEWKPVFGLAAQETYQTQPNTVAALCALLAEAGARRVVLVENLYWEKPFEQVLTEAGWDVNAILAAANQRVTFEDTRNRGSFRGYSRFKVPWGGYVYPAFDVNQRFEQTDVLISLAKLKQHATAGITGAVKNLFGITPSSIYGDDGPGEHALKHRAAMFHGGRKKPPAGAPGELDHGVPSQGPRRVPRIVADIFGARPSEINIVEGVRTISGGEGWWNKGIALKEPKLLLAGRNGVCTDAVATAVMGFDPEAPHGQKPFPGDNHLRLLAQAGVGAIDLKHIEVRGLKIKDAVCQF
jgi:uncharacterized protein (DUF362 family)